MECKCEKPDLTRNRNCVKCGGTRPKKTDESSHAVATESHTTTDNVIDAVVDVAVVATYTAADVVSEIVADIFD